MALTYAISQIKLFIQTEISFIVSNAFFYVGILLYSMINGYQKSNKTVAILLAYITDGYSTDFSSPPLHSPLLYHLFFSSYAHTPCYCVEKLVRFINRSLRCSGWGNFQLSLIGKYGLQLRLSQSKQLGWRSINMAEESSGGEGEKGAREMEIEIERNENSTNGFGFGYFAYFESKT